MANIQFGSRKATNEQAAMPGGPAEAERRLRQLEERYSNLERRGQVTEENMLGSDRKIKSEIKLLGSEVSELKAQVNELGEKVRAVVRELQGFARTEDVDVIRKYLNLLEPLGFATRTEVERIVKDAIEEAVKREG